jgi:HPt (histidine-containing phosphotransfer) domain-containing protein
MSESIDAPNWEALLELDESDDRSFVIELIDSFLEECPKAIASIRSHIDLQEFELAARRAHSIKGSAQALAQKSLSRELHHLEDLLGNQELDLIRQSLDRLISEFRNSTEWLQTEKSNLTS